MEILLSNHGETNHDMVILKRKINKKINTL